MMLNIAIKFFLIMFLGGVGTLFGPIIGAVFLEFVSTTAWTRLLDYHLGVLGLIMIIVVVAIPGGFMEFARHRVQQMRLLFDPGRR
jgi:branched-chain amino acid transport system permease protein